jgi:hypothetical protein
LVPARDDVWYGEHSAAVQIAETDVNVVFDTEYAHCGDPGIERRPGGSDGVDVRVRVNQAWQNPPAGQVDHLGTCRVVRCLPNAGNPPIPNNDVYVQRRL